MSSLIRQSHATNDKPLWISTSGTSDITGNLNVSGGIQGQYITATSGFSLLDNSNPKTQVLSVACATNNPGGNPIFQVGPGGAFRFGQYSQAAANTTLTPSAPGSGLDNFTIYGSINASSVATNSLKLNNMAPNAIVGTGTIPVGATNVVIPTTSVTANSKIFFSFYGSPSAGPGNGPSQGNLINNSSLNVVGTSFRVDHTDENGISVAVAGVPVTFNWMIINS